MCGLTVLWDPDQRLSPNIRHTRAEAMTTALHHRGPDAGAVWADERAGLLLGHRRLSIIDLSDAGAQPMVSRCGRYVLAYNGEVYNAAALRAGVDVPLRGHSDTELILEHAAKHGLRKTLQTLTGMLALALWDRKTRTLTLARDRVGIKPLFYGVHGGVLRVGSELKALMADPDLPRELDRTALTGFARHAYVPAPHSILAGVNALPPGCMATVTPDLAVEVTRYWDLRDIAATTSRAALSDTESLAALEESLTEAVRSHLVADVPVGAFLSGGVDSSAVVALMTKVVPGRVRTFSIGFAEDGYDESAYAAAVAKHLGTEHTTLMVTSAEAQAVIPALPTMFDAPFADPSQIPTFLVSKLAREQVTVALSGDGGDELYAGYTRYAWGERLRRRVLPWPAPLRQGVAAGLDTLGPGFWNKLETVLPGGLLPSQLADKAVKLAEVLRLDDPGALYRRLVSQWRDPDLLVPGAEEPATVLWDEALTREIPDPVARMQLLDALTYLPDDILTKVDRASMAVSLESRVPLLDHRVVEQSWALPRTLHLRGTEAKWGLRQVLYKHVPRALIERPKMGFGVPIGDWLRGPLRDWAEDLLRESRLNQHGLFDPVPVRDLWARHLAGQVNGQYQLWIVLMGQAWADTWRPSA